MAHTADLATEPLEIPQRIADAVFHYRTCEFCTVTSRGAPVSWPVIGLYEREQQRFLVSTPIGMPFKAYHLRRNPRCALLFSNPTSSGLHLPPAVLLQGQGECPDEILVGYGNPDVVRLARHVHSRQPGGEMYVKNPVLRWLMDWYYMRLLVYVTPERTTWWEQGDTKTVPTSLGQLLAPTRRPSVSVPGSNDEALEKLSKQLERYDSAVLSGVDGSGYPFSVRCHPRASEGPRLALDLRPELPLEPGPAQLLFHSHDEKVGKLRSCAARGSLVATGSELHFLPTHFQPGIGMGGPIGRLRMVRRCRRNARRYLERRELDRPVIPWDEIASGWKALSDSHARG